MHLETIVKFMDEDKLRLTKKIQQHLSVHTALLSILFEKYRNKSYSINIK